MDLPISPPVRLTLPGKRVCFWGAPAALPPGDSDQTHWSTKLEQTGGNTGNLFIGHGLYHQTDAAMKAYHPGFGALKPTAFDDAFDCLMVPASNFVNSALDLQPMYDYFKHTRTPIYCFGLGSQVIPGESIVLKPGTEAFLRLIAERSGTIGVRGAFTADILWTMGIRNTSLTGCPSLLGLTDETIRQLVTARPTLEKVATNYSNNVRRHSFDPEAQRLTENSLFAAMLEHNSFYILQNEGAEFELVDIAMGRGDRTAGPPALAVTSRLFDLTPEHARFRTYMATRLRAFFAVPQWIYSMRTMSASVGTRFHGNIASILAGTPGMVLVHDMRTLELAELFCIPHLVVDRAYSADEIIERLLNLDYRPFARRISALRADWRAFADRNGFGAT